MEDLIAESRLQTKELLSLITVLQKAVQNEESDLTREVDDCLELAINKINNILEEIDKIYNTLANQ
jgi:hypothetical protein